MEKLNNILKTTTGKKMIASLLYGFESKGKFDIEYNFISELPLAQQELFDTLWMHCSGFNTRIDLAMKLCNKGEI